ncbi:MAG: Rrf2 family transcriptional regulator [Hyphomicrobiaceae bacterium]|nr:Rrf2 family transcriptional regulator [Hyphomicrobiaceae bacterium]
MKLTRHTNYALRALQLAALKAPERVRVEDVASIHGLARPHIVKIVHKLGRGGFIVTQRGRKGGFTLARPAGEISVGAVVRLTEGSMDLVECFDPDENTCPLLGVCHLSVALHRAMRAFMDVLDDLTIADISANRGALLERIGPLDGHSFEGMRDEH